ncbi:ATP-binding protein [Mycolicibacterium smegmatis]|uniref:Adenylate and Guanylate cyclase catalytic domain protein n=1 Tax=Mycolicibacterium smegmatis (strain MKD8) TaxID=1214915 RepID=A0A2U9Q048_MYCSE|nr:adenylate/guanylate cyclase domain-containing protein [Mycolicibacterium smegmatis]AWT57413.1 adenylate and Guanylate cyclase catalytic domain protein [Mycolicibacterium smegmatis MKD8]
MTPGENSALIDDLLDRAVRAVNDGDRATAATLAGQVLAVDHDNPDAEDLLSASDHGEIRRLTIMFADLVDSTALSTRIEPESYHTLIGQFRKDVVRIVDSYEGHISSVKGDGVLVLFGHPKPHENDVRRAVSAGLDITNAVAQISEQAQRRFGVTLDVRVGIHRGVVYLDVEQDDIYGLAANLAARLTALAEPGSVVVSDVVAPLVREYFELDDRPPVPVKGIDGNVAHHVVAAERSTDVPARSVPLIGRERERACLRECCRRAHAGTLDAAGVAFRGEAGIGKTRMAVEAADMVRASGGTVVELRGSPLHTDTGLYPIRRLIERRCGITRLTEGATRLQLLKRELHSLNLDPESMVPFLAPVLGVGPEHGYQPAAVEAHALYELIAATVQQYLTACFGGGMSLLVTEDVHWYDPSTCELVGSTLTAAGGRLLVVMTGREGTWLRDDWPVEVFDLTPLNDEESDALIRALDPAVGQEQRAEVCRRCDGVPFHIEHVVAGLGALEDQVRVPEALYDPLFARMHTDSAVVPVLEAAAVIGRTGDLALLRSVVGDGAQADTDTETGPDVDGVVTALTDIRVLEPAGPEGWRFRHELLREVAVELAPPSVHRQLHARTAHALVRAAVDVEPDWPVVAGHYAQAHRFAEAAQAFQKASVVARRRGALQEALDCLTNALTQISHCHPGPSRDRAEIAVRLERGFILGTALGTMSGEVPREFERCLDLATAGDSDDDLFAALSALVSYYVPRAELRRARDLLESLPGRLTENRKWSYPAITSSLGSVLWLQGDFAAARKYLDRSLEEWADHDPRELDNAWWVNSDPVSTAHTYLALVHLGRGDLTRADAELIASVRRCENLEYPQNAYNRQHTYFKEIWVCLECGRLDRAAVLAADMRRCAEQAGLDLWRMVSSTEYATVKALMALRDGADPETLRVNADKIIRRVDGSRMMSLNVYLTFHDAVIGRLLTAAGHPDRARERLDMALRHAEETGMHFHDAELMRERARTLDDPADRRAQLDAAKQLANQQGAVLFELRCALDCFELTRDTGELRSTLDRFPGDHRWPERVRAERILS